MRFRTLYAGEGRHRRECVRTAINGGSASHAFADGGSASRGPSCTFSSWPSAHTETSCPSIALGVELIRQGACAWPWRRRLPSRRWRVRAGVPFHGLGTPGRLRTGRARAGPLASAAWGCSPCSTRSSGRHRADLRVARAGARARGGDPGGRLQPQPRRPGGAGQARPARRHRPRHAAPDGEPARRPGAARPSLARLVPVAHAALARAGRATATSSARPPCPSLNALRAPPRPEPPCAGCGTGGTARPGSADVPGLVRRARRRIGRPQAVQIGFPARGPPRRHGRARARSSTRLPRRRAGAPGLHLRLGDAAGRAPFFETAIALCRRMGRRGVLLAPQDDQVPPDAARRRDPRALRALERAPAARRRPDPPRRHRHRGAGARGRHPPAASCRWPSTISTRASACSRLGLGTTLSRRRFTPAARRTSPEPPPHLARTSPTAAGPSGPGWPGRTACPAPATASRR